MDTFFVVGINHWKAPVDVREKFSIGAEQQLALLDQLRARGYKDSILLSTCNRSELYLRGAELNDVASLYVEHSRGTLDEFAQHHFASASESAVRHFFRVSAGLDSRILGDQQIISQMKLAWKRSAELELTTSFSHRLMQLAAEAHKLIRNETDLGSGTASIASAATAYLRSRLPNLADKRILVVGAGKIGTVTLKNLQSMGAKEIYVMNRKPERAKQVSEAFGAPAVPFDNLNDEILRADVVIVATGAEEPIIRAETLRDMNLTEVKHLVDLSVPRNIESEAGELPLIELANVDELEGEAEAALRKRAETVPLAERIVEDKIAKFIRWYESQKVAPTIKALTDKLHAIRMEEVEQHKNKFNDADLEKIDWLTHRIINKISNQSISFLKDNEYSDEVKALVEQMFGLESESPA